MSRDFQAVLWDFGGVILSSPFEAFNRYEAQIGLPRDFIRRVNAVAPDHNAWAQMERSEIGLIDLPNCSRPRHARSAASCRATPCSGCSAARCARRWSRH